jgi:hypothetical protein
MINKNYFSEKLGGFMKFLISLSLILLTVSQFAFAQNDQFAENKKKILEGVGKTLSIATAQKTCVTNAKKWEEIKICNDIAMAEFDKLRKENEQKKKENDQRLMNQSQKK